MKILKEISIRVDCEIEYHKNFSSNNDVKGSIYIIIDEIYNIAK